MFFSPSLGLRWENSLQCDTEIENKVRLHIRMRLATTNIPNRLRVHHSVWLTGTPNLLSVIGPVVTTGSAQGCVLVSINHCHVVVEKMGVRGQLLDVDRNSRRTGGLA